MIELDATAGGQVFRNSIGFSALLQKPVKLVNIRNSRPNPGLKAQHLTSLNTLSQICNAEVTGNNPSSQEISFTPKEVKESKMNVNIGTAGSITLLLQTLHLPSLLKKTELRIIGGTDVPFAPSANYMQNTLFPFLNKMKTRYSSKIISHGYYPKGQGILSFKSNPPNFPLKSIKLTESGIPTKIFIFSHSCSLPKEVTVNQLKAAKKKLSLLNADIVDHLSAKEKSSTIGSGIDIFAETEKGAIIGANSLGKKGKWANTVGEEAAEQLLSELKAEKPVDAHLADQLIPFMAIAKGKSEIHCTKLTDHTLSSIIVAEAFCDVKFKIEGALGESCIISVDGCSFKP